MRIRLSTLIFGSTTVLVGIALLVLFVITTRATATGIETLERELLETEVAALESSWLEWLEAQIVGTVRYASDPTIQAATSTEDPATIRQALEGRLAQEETSVAFMELRIDGMPVILLGPSPPGAEWATREDFFGESTVNATGDVYRSGDDLVFVAGAPIASVGVGLGSLAIGHSISDRWLASVAMGEDSEVVLELGPEAVTTSDASIAVPDRDGGVVGRLTVTRSGEVLDAARRDLLRSELQVSFVVLFVSGLIGLMIGRLARRELSVVGAAVARLTSGEGEPGSEVSRLRDLDPVLEQVRDVRRILEETRSELEKSERMAVLGTMAGAVAHDVRTPLTSIVMSVDMLRRGTNEDQQDRLLSRVESESQRIERLMEDLTEFARGNRTPDFERVSLTVWMGDIEAYWREWLVAKRVAFSASLEGIDEWTMDASRLRRAVDNLVKNASEAVSGRDSARVTVSIDRTSQGAMRLRVADNGEGVPESILPDLFTPFVSKKKRGTGLGLSIVKSAVEDHGGSVTVQTSDQGTVFELLLPVQLT